MANIMNIRRMVMMQSADMLPPGYTAYDYLETKGHNARIDTGVDGNDTTIQIYGDVMFVEYRAYNAFFGNVASSCKQYRCIQPSSQTSKYISFGTYKHNNSPITVYSGIWESPFRMKFLVRYGYVEAEINGTKYSFTENRDDEKDDQTANNIAIGSSSVGGTGGSNKNRIYGYKIWKQGSLVRVYRPCVRRSDNKAGLYDMVNHTFNSSIGSAQFVAANDV